MAARRLPVVQRRDEDAPPRSGWQWMLVAAVLTTTLWVPLAMIAAWLAAHATEAMFPGASPADVERAIAAARTGRRALVLAFSAVPHAIALGLAAAFAGAIVGRFGGSSGPREAASGAVVTVGFACALTAVSLGANALVLALPAAAVAAAGGWWGGRFGKRRR